MAAKTIMITSGKGGVGKSSVCAGVAYYLARQNKKVLVMEMDSGLRCLDIMLGVAETTVHDISDVLSGVCEPIKAIYPSPLCPTLAIMPATLRPEAPYTPALFYKLCRGLASYYDYIFIETPAGFGQTLCDIAAVSDLAVLVVTPDPISLRDAKIVSDYLDTQRLSKQRIVVNKVRTEHGRLELLPDLDAVIDTVREPLMGVVPYEPQIVKLLGQGKTVTVDLPAGRALRNIAKRLNGEFVELEIR